MLRLNRILPAGCLLVCLMFARAATAQSIGDAAGTPDAANPQAAAKGDAAAEAPGPSLGSSETQKPKVGESDKPAAAPPAPQKPKQLKPELASLRDQVRRALAQHQNQALNTRDNSATEIMNYCLGFGCNTEVLLEGPGGRKLNGITCLCWGYPCAGFEMLGRGQDHIVARIGYGYQERPGEFLAMLAMSRVPPTYPIRSGKTTRTVADLVEAEKLSCRSGGDLSLKLIALQYYLEQPTWKNNLDEDWSLERIIREELAQPVVAASDGGLNRLMGLSYAVVHRAKHNEPIEGQYQRAQKYISDFHDFALALQNTDGSWGPYLLTARSTSPDPGIQLRSTGRVLEWLAVSLPDERLEDPRVIRAVETVTRLLSSQRYGWNVPSLSTREIGAVGHALHALTMYDERVFKPADAAEKPPAEKPSPATASRGMSKQK
jgi:hypothetical protein